jgi:hypothetical protein
MFYDVWEKRIVYLPDGPAPPGGGGEGGVPTPPIYYPPEIWPPIPPEGGGGVPTPPIYYPPEVWPPLPGGGFPGHPSHPIYNPPGIWPRPPGPVDPGWGVDVPVRPEHPIYNPPGGGGGGGQAPPVSATPLPPDYAMPTEPPTAEPDLASPGTWCTIVGRTPKAGDKGKRAWIQLAFEVSEGHTPRPPTKGLPGEWVAVYSAETGPRHAWVPTRSASPGGPEVEPPMVTPPEPAPPGVAPHERRGFRH